MRRRIVLAVAAGVALGACRSTVRADLSEHEANQLVVALDAASIAASKESASGARDRFRVEVPSADAARAIALLEAQHLPRRDAAGEDALHAQSSLLATPQEERARATAATEAALARSLERLRGVLEAHVHIALPDAERALDAAPAPRKAAVLLQRARGAAPIDEVAVRSLIAGAVDGLRAEHVTVVQASADTAPATAPKLAYVGPIAVSRASAPWLRALLAAALALDLLMAIALLILLRRSRGARRAAAIDG